MKEPNINQVHIITEKFKHKYGEKRPLTILILLKNTNNWYGIFNDGVAKIEKFSPVAYGMKEFDR